MKQKQKKARWLPVIAAAGVMLMVCKPAHAGWWELSYRITGTKSMSRWSSSYSGSKLQVVPGTIWYEGPGNDSSWSAWSFGNDANDRGWSMQGDLSSASAKVDVVVALTWQANKIWDEETWEESDDPADLPEEKVTLRVVSSALAQGYRWSFGPGTGDTSSSASNGLGDGAKLTKSFNAPNVLQGQKSVSSNWEKPQLFQIDNSKREYIIFLDKKTLEAAATAAGEPYYEPPNSDNRLAYSEVQLYFKAELDPHKLQITSDIEKSYRKSTGTLSPPHDKRDVQGNLLFAVQVAGQNTEVINDDVWKLQCLPESDGSMKVHSAATWIDPLAYGYRNDDELNKSLSESGWWGDIGDIKANAEGYTTPQYQWKMSGGGLTNPFDSSKLKVIPDPTLELEKDQPKITIKSALASYGEPYGIGARRVAGVYGLRLGSGLDGDDLTKESTFSVDVAEMDPASATALLDGSYTVNWHLPDEGWDKKSESAAPDDYFPFGPVPATGDPFIYNQPPREAKYNYRNGVKLGTAIFDVGINAYKLLRPEAKVGAGVASLLKAALTTGVVYSETQPSAPPQTAQLDASYTQLRQDVLSQAGDEAGDPECTVEIDIPSDVLQRLITNFRNGTTAANNADWKSGRLRIETEARYPNHSEQWNSDTYDEHGFSGIGEHSVTVRGGRSAKRKWTWDENPAN